jgi:nitrite reductase/ring-hydroxylating ferredoxin subunit
MRLDEGGGRQATSASIDDGFREGRGHRHAPLDKAACVARLTSPEPVVHGRSRFGEPLRCAWRRWEFDVRDGQSWVRPEAGRGPDPIPLWLRTEKGWKGPCP